MLQLTKGPGVPSILDDPPGPFFMPPLYAQPLLAGGAFQQLQHVLVAVAGAG